MLLKPTVIAFLQCHQTIIQTHVHMLFYISVPCKSGIRIGLKHVFIKILNYVNGDQQLEFL